MLPGYMVTSQQILINGKSLILDSLVGDKWQIKDVKTNEISHIKIDEFQKRYAQGEIEFISKRSEYVPESIKDLKYSKIAAHLDLYPQSDQEYMKQVRVFLESYLKRYGDNRSQKVMATGIKELWNSLWGASPHPSTTLRWLKRYIESGKDIRSIAPANFKKGNKKPRIDSSVVDACRQAIEKIYLHTSRGSINKTLVEAMSYVNKENKLRPSEMKLLMPTKSFIKSLIKSIPEFDKYARRFGKNAAEHKFRNAVHSIVCTRPLQRVEVDHTRLDIILIDPKTGLVIGRPWLTLILDVFTRSILSFSLSYDPPSHMTVARALKMALLPKAEIKSRWPSIAGVWPMHGCMDEIVVDNGFEFHCDSLEAACLTLGITISFCPRKKGWWKAHIERCIGTLNRAVTDGMPGRTFANITEKAEYNPADSAAIHLALMEEMIAKWIVDVYHETTHSVTGLKPNQAWVSAIDEADIPLIANPKILDEVMGVIAHRALSHRGIEINSLVYNSNELGVVRQKFGNLKDIVIKWDPEDLGFIHAFAPDGTTLRVPVITKFSEYAANLTLYQHKHYREYSKTFLEGRDDVDALNEAKLSIQEMAEIAVSEKSSRTRINAYRMKANAKKESETKKNNQTNNEISPVFSSSNIKRPEFATKLSNRSAYQGEN